MLATITESLCAPLWVGTKKYCGTIFLAEARDSWEGSKACNFLPGWSTALRQFRLCCAPSAFECPQPGEQLLLDYSSTSRNMKIPKSYLQLRDTKKTPFPHPFRRENWQEPNSETWAQKEGCSERQKDTVRVGPTDN